MQCSVKNIFWLLETTFDGYILLKAAMYYFRLLYTTYGGYILFSTTIYFFWRLYITFDVYILHSALPYCDFVRLQDFLLISRVCELKASLELNSNFLALKECSGQYSILIWIHIVTENEKLCKIYFKKPFFQNNLAFTDHFYTYHYIHDFINSDYMWRVCVQYIIK